MGATGREGQEKMEENWILPKIDAPKIPGREFEWQAVSNRIQNTLYGPSLCPRGRITVRNSLPNKAQNTGTSLPLFPEFCWDLWLADCHRDTGGQVDTCLLAFASRDVLSVFSFGDFWLYQGEESKPHSLAPVLPIQMFVVAFGQFKISCWGAGKMVLVQSIC